MTDQKSNCLLFQLLESLFGESSKQTTNTSRDPVNTEQTIDHSSQVQINSDDRSAEGSPDAMDTQHSDSQRRRRSILDLIPFFNRTEPSISWVGNAIGLAAAIGIFAFVDARINHLFDKKITPYQELIRGMTLVDSGEEEIAIKYLDKAFLELTKDLKEVDTADEFHYPAVDYYLEAITNSRDPEIHQHRFGRILKLEEENQYVFLGWHNNQIGWYYFRTGDLESAQKHFNKAIQQYALREYFPEAAYSFWALMLISLCEGDLDSAMLNYQEARRRDYTFHPDAALIDLRYMDEDEWFLRLIRLYDIENHVPAFIDQLENLDR